MDDQDTKKIPKRSFRNRAFALLAFLLPVLAYNACGAPGTDSGKKSSTGQPLAVIPSVAVVSSGDSFQMTVTGGSPPYHYSKQTGSGSVTTGGKFVSTAVVGQADGSRTYTTVEIIDSADAVAYMTVTVIEGSYIVIPGNTGGLGATSSPSPMRGAGPVTLYGVGGTPPYIFAIIQGAGTIVGSLVSVPNATQTLIIRVHDSTGATADFQLPVTAI
jgi:hypothetical protein